MHCVLLLHFETYVRICPACLTLATYCTQDGDCWNEALFHEAMTKAVHDATTPSSSPSCAAVAPLVAAA
jgi:hypothetical protein